ncbi:flavodoxin domain-containing protein, partial [Microvirga sp. 3-52]|nr:flavodoxin domain-containing protein [Microvirga sp. 3-52]
MVSFLIAYATWSGNTEEVAELIEEVVLKSDIDVTKYRIGTGLLPDVRAFDALIIGSFTWDKGATPDEVKDF